MSTNRQKLTAVGHFLIALALAVVFNLLLFTALAHLNQRSIRLAVTTPPPAIYQHTPTPISPQLEQEPPSEVVEEEPEPMEVNLDMQLPAVEVKMPELPMPALNLSGLDLSGVAVPQAIQRYQPPPRARTVAPQEAPRPQPRQQQGPMTESEVDQAPQPLHTPPPRYPRSAIRTGAEGSVTFKLLIDETGQVETIEILESHGHPGFARAVQRTASNWSYTPAVHNSANVKVWGIKTVQFKLAD